jgi:hypothetical protein
MDGVEIKLETQADLGVLRQVKRKAIILDTFAHKEYQKSHSELMDAIKELNIKSTAPIKP